MSTLPAPGTAAVPAVAGMFTYEVSPPAGLFWSRLPEGEVKGESPPLPLPDAGRSVWGREEKGPRGEGTPKILPGSASEGREVVQGAGIERREVWSFPRQHMVRELTP